MNERSIDQLRKVVAETPRAVFHPMAFFVARCGVLTLVFDGFSSALLDLKRRIEEVLPGLEPEREGSTWPKVTLAVLRDDESLSVRDIVRLRDIADEWNDVLLERGDILGIDRLVAVEYACRSLEQRKRTIQLPFGQAHAPDETSEQHAAYVRSVVSQFSRTRMDRYAAELEKEGHRETHYRSPSTGWSLIAEVAPDRLPLANKLLEEVERLVPGKYLHLAPESRHITIRSLDTGSETRDRVSRDATSLSESVSD